MRPGGPQSSDGLQPRRTAYSLPGVTAADQRAAAAREVVAHRRAKAGLSVESLKNLRDGFDTKAIGQVKSGSYWINGLGMR